MAILRHIVRYDELLSRGYFEKKMRIKTESEAGYGRKEAKEEASRCFHCGHCFACGICVDVCPGDILAMVDQQPHVVYPEECYHCGACLIDCPASAISFHIPLPLTLPTYPADFFDKRHSKEEP